MGGMTIADALAQDVEGGIDGLTERHLVGHALAGDIVADADEGIGEHEGETGDIADIKVGVAVGDYLAEGVVFVEEETAVVVFLPCALGEGGG